MPLQSVKYTSGKLEILDQLLLPVQSKYLAVKGVEDGWKAINKMQTLRQEIEGIGGNGASIILKCLKKEGPVRILSHSNTGSLATAGYGTALSVVRELHELKKLEHVYCTETRPYNQGARLTAYELVHDQLPATLVLDSIVAALLRAKNIAAVVVGADRVAANGDTEINHHDVPFFVAAPLTSIDLQILNITRATGHSDLKYSNVPPFITVTYKDKLCRSSNHK
uniref:S-methyl-5-thioribose-1-phosphate isomerase n=1 Tax=Glossina brevipalpis TaxID=37001 RepID=A0A1A9WJ55_9MUSC